MLNVRDLRNMLEGLDDDMEVRIASQPNWPFEYSVDEAEVVTFEADDNSNNDDEEKEILYLAEGTQLGYLPQVVRDYIGW